MKKPPIRYLRNESLARHTSLGVGGPVRYFFEPADGGELAALLRYLHAEGVRPLVIGGGTNLFVADRPGVRAAVSMNKIRGLSVKGNKARALAGEPLARVVLATVKQGLGGLEVLAGIPGTVGGAVMMNAGGGRGAIGDVVNSVDTLDALSRRRTFARDELRFSYRRGPFKKRIVIAVEFGLRKAGKKALDLFKKIKREKARAQPLGARSAGCWFRNPPGMSAGELIERAGLKGIRVGGAAVSKRHANFVVNTGSASAKDISTLIDIIVKTVYDNSAVYLRPEVKTVETAFGGEQ
jgi:UDP-N-acetylmuramate dehydrogenase